MTLNRIQLIGFFLAFVGLYSCKKEKINFNNLNDTIIVRHKKADMPAYVHGNGSEKVFLIILHGGPGGTGLQYRVNNFKSEVERNNAVVYFDQRGSGNAQGAYAKADVSVDLMAEDVLALVKVLKAKYGNDSRFFLMGHSWGGTLGPATLLKNQGDFLGWIDVDGSHSPRDTYNEYKRAIKKIAEEQIARGNSIAYWNGAINTTQSVSQTYNDEDFFKLNGEAHEGEDKLVDDGVINELRFDGAKFFEYNFLSTLWNSKGIRSLLVEKGLFEKLSYTDRLAEITIPSLVLWGKYDIIVPTVYAQEAYDNLGSTNKELFIFNKSGHSPMFSEPELFAEKLIGFINQYK